MATVLVVDDRRDDRELVALTLEREGHVVRRAMSAADALLDIEQDGVPDLLITDVAMPEADGYALVQALADRRVVPEMGVVFYSAYSTPEETHTRGGVFAACGHLMKPTQPASILAAVRERLRGRGASPADDGVATELATRVAARMGTTSTFAGSRRHDGNAPRNASVLVVDDNIDNLALARILLEREGYTVTTASGGEEAVAKAIELEPRLVLLDLHMPGVDGFEVATRLRREPTLAHTRVVALTASYMQPGDRERTLAAGFDGYLTKPIAPSVFAGQVAPFVSSD
jgi:CheY-like chemotaxis protein